MKAMTEEHVFQCTGCESECDVHVRVQDGKIVAVEGNDCPTGASYATSQYKMKTASKTQTTQNKI
jgi:CxxC motif-containing protein